MKLGKKQVAQHSMQLTLVFPEPVQSAAASTPAAFVADASADLRTLLAAHDAATSVADAATASDAILLQVQPQAERAASLFLAVWPVDDVTTEDLTNEVLGDVLAGLPFAPRHGTTGFHIWLSSTLISGLHQRFVAAKAEVRRRADAMRRLAGVATAAWDDEDTEEEEQPLAIGQRAHHGLALQAVLAAMDAEAARLLRWRAAGQTWAHIARRLDVSPRTAYRRHAAALDLARRIAHGTPQDWAVTNHAA